MTLFSEKVPISNRCISGLISNLGKKSWTDSITLTLRWDIELVAALEFKGKKRDSFGVKKRFFTSLQIHFIEVEWCYFNGT